MERCGDGSVPPTTPPIHARPTFVALLLAAIAVGVTWPLATALGSALPGNLGDPLLNTFTLGWGSDRLLAGLRGFWDGRAFFPHHDTVAFSEHLLGITRSWRRSTGSRRTPC